MTRLVTISLPVPRNHLAMLLALALVVPPLILAGQAKAGEYTISTCQANGAFASGAFDVFATRGMKWRRACNPLGPGLRGLVTANVARSGRVAVGAQSAFVLDAPPQTSFSRLRWSGNAHRRDCRYALQLYALRPDGSAVGIKNVRANRACPRSDRAQASSWPRPRAYDLAGATRIVQRVVCVGAASAGFCSGQGQNFLQTFVAEATVTDPIPPSVAVVPDRPLARGEWVRGAQDVGYEAVDNVGIKAAKAWVGGVERGEEPRACDYSQRIPCPNGAGRIEVDTSRLTEGTQHLFVSAEDASGNPANSAVVSVRVDNTAPGAVPLAVEGGEGWRNVNRYSLVWTNQPEGDRAPIVAATYQLCRAGGGDCSTSTVTGVGVSRIDALTVSAPGEWEARVWRADAAGNQQADNASQPVRLRFDPEPPTLGFEALDPSDPTRVAVAVEDRVSGLGSGGIELSRVGSGTWQVLPSTQEGDTRLIARIDDAALPAGDYELRASAYDKAGNLASTSHRLDGAPARLTLPLRVVSSLRAGVLEKRAVRDDGKKREGQRKVTVLLPRKEMSFGHRVRLAGKLTDAAGNPLSGAPIEVYSRPPEQAEALIATLTTGARGGFEFSLKGKTSSRLRFTYAGSTRTLPSEAQANLLVHGTTSFTANRRRVLNGQAVIFKGRVRGRPLPEGGKLIELQYRASDEWSTFRTIRSDSDGSWRIRYPFKRTCGIQKFVLRPRLPGEAGYPLASGAGPRLALRAKGRPCSGS